MYNVLHISYYTCIICLSSIYIHILYIYIYYMRTIYIGEVTIVKGDKPLVTLTVGQAFGELAFFSATGMYRCI